MKPLSSIPLVFCFALIFAWSPVFRRYDLFATSLRLEAGLQTSRLTARVPPADLDWVTEAGGVVIRDQAGRVTGVDLRSSWVTDSDLSRLVEFPYLTRLDL